MKACTMSSKSCVFKNNGEENEEPDNLMPPCFQISPDIQLKEVPTNGEEYLLSVMKERENYNVVTKCDKDYSKFAKNQSCFVEEMPRAKAPDKLKPTKEWQNIQVADFSDVRMYLSRLLAKKSSWPSKVKKIEIEQSNLVGWKNFFSKNDPTLSCVLGLSHAHLEQGLENLTKIICEVNPGESIDHETGQWIYAFLACTRQPLLSETTSVLRDLARKCAEIRSHINEDDENAVSAVAPLNIFICIVSQYFRQYDLAD